MSKTDEKNMKILEGKNNVFLTGAGGTGKSYLLNQYIENHKNVIVTASTGTAATDIGGSTVHRAFSVPVPAYGANPEKITPSQLTPLIKADTVIIDEISMCRCDVFSFMVRVLNRAEKLKGEKIKVIVSGDFFQLPPVVKKSEESYFTKFGFNKSGFAFTTKEWKALKFKTLHLDHIYRQEDKEFIEMLSLARIGDDSCVPYFNQFLGSAEGFDGVYVCGTNLEAEQINNDYLNEIDAPVIAYQAEKHGITGKDLPTDEIILMKVGARVMFTTNDTVFEGGSYNKAFETSATGRYQNGTFGTVKEVYRDRVIVVTDRGEEIEVGRHKWSVYSYKVKGATIEKTEIGYVSQIPLKLAYAITIHKSQGKTFEKAVISPKIFAAGQLYVALSRVSSPSGLILTEPILPEYLKVDSVVEKFYDDFSFDVPDSIVQKQKKIEAQQKAKKKRKTTKRKTTATKATKKSTTKKKTTGKKTTTRKSVAKAAPKKKASTRKVTAKKTTGRKTNKAKK